MQEQNLSSHLAAKVSLPVIKRLPRYYRTLKTLQGNQITSVSSRELASLLGMTASQVRQDFNCFGDVNGRQGIGYSVDTLLAMLEDLLFRGERLPAILLGAGRLGKAVSRFISTDTNGYKLLAIFDVNPAEVGTTIGDIPIRHLDELEQFCKEYHPQVAVLCLPRDGAREISSKLVDYGIKGYWNFSHYDLSVPHPEVVVENVHLGDSLMSLGYRMRNE
ncbi:MAG: redox-sensing transcriptional repressor Rex [Faecalibacterium sp.]